MSFETISIETDDRGVATLTLNRAEKHNSLSAK
jgi:methylglutaconyl-CoA hydratase